MDGDAVEEVTADGVEVDQYRRGAVVDCFRVADEIRGDAPKADFAVDADLDGGGEPVPSALSA